MLVKLTEKEFNKFSSDIPNSMFFQSSDWGVLKESNGWKYEIVGIKDKNNKIKAASLLLKKKMPIINMYFYYLPRGFLCDFNNHELIKEFTLELKKYVKNNKGIFFKINPLILYQERDINGNIVVDGTNNKDLVDYLKRIGYKHKGLTTTYGKEIEPRWISELNLVGLTKEQYKANLRTTTRSDINYAYKSGLEIVEIGFDRISEFKELMEHTGERRGFIDRPLSYYQNMYNVLSKSNNIKIMLVELDLEKSNENQKQILKNAKDKMEYEQSKGHIRDGLKKELEKQIEAANRKIEENSKLIKERGNKIVVAGGLFMLFGKQLVSLFGASYREFMKYKGQYLLNDAMINYAIDNNYDKYNFYGITGEFNEESPMFGLFDFKRGFNSDVIELIGEFDYVVNKPVYTMYNILFKLYKNIKKLIKKLKK